MTRAPSQGSGGRVRQEARGRRGEAHAGRHQGGGQDFRAVLGPWPRTRKPSTSAATHRKPLCLSDSSRSWGTRPPSSDPMVSSSLRTTSRPQAGGGGIHRDGPGSAPRERPGGQGVHQEVRGQARDHRPVFPERVRWREHHLAAIKRAGKFDRAAIAAEVAKTKNYKGISSGRAITFNEKGITSTPPSTSTR